MAMVPQGVEILPKITIAWVGCTNVTDDRQTDGRWHIANMNLSSRSLITIELVAYAICTPTSGVNRSSESRHRLMCVDLAEILGGRMASADVGSVPSGVGYGEGCPLSSRLGGLGSFVSSFGGFRRKAPVENGFWRILKATERSFLYLYDKNLRGQFALAPPYSKFWGYLSPASPLCDLRPWP